MLWSFCSIWCDTDGLSTRTLVHTPEHIHTRRHTRTQQGACPHTLVLLPAAPLSCTCAHVHIHAYTCAHIHIHACTGAHIHIHAYTCAHTHTSMPIRAHTHTHPCLCMCTPPCAPMMPGPPPMCPCQIYTCTLAYTHTQPLPPKPQSAHARTTVRAHDAWLSSQLPLSKKPLCQLLSPPSVAAAAPGM